MNFKPLTIRLFLITIFINFVLITFLAWVGNWVISTKDELTCQENMNLLQKALNRYNREHLEDKKASMEFGFPGFVENILIPANYLGAPIQDLREKHSYHLQRNGFVNCRLHPRNPDSLYIMGLIILTVLASVLELGFWGYQIPWKEK